MALKEQESPARGLWERLPGSGICGFVTAIMMGNCIGKKWDVRVMRLIF